MKQYFRVILLNALLLLVTAKGFAQNDIFVNMAMVDGVDLTPDNLFSFQVQSGLKKSSHSLIRGNIKFRNSDLRIAYRFEYDLQPGLNIIPANAVRPQFEYSSQPLRELFEQYKKLPEGIYEYCVSVKPDYNLNESTPGPVYNECVYHKSQDVFLINLIDPDNDAKIYEYNPMLSWTVNYPFASELKYRIRVAEIKEGQNTTGAINRNNPVYDERNLMQMSIVYPVYGKPLQKNQPYVWTVDAYYKGLLLGGAEPWKFTIIEDSLLSAIPRDPSFVDVKRENGSYGLYAPGVLKLKYDLTELKTDSLSLQLLDKNDKEIGLKEAGSLKAVYGDNRFILDFKESQPLKHLQPYTLLIKSQTGSTYRIFFKYANPELLK
ncbi:MAG: hypothetical protein WC756_06670 [Taibaiella sp.]|jgi:hypothetical protein